MMKKEEEQSRMRSTFPIYDRTVTSEGRGVQSVLRRTMSKLLGDRMISKQEKYHLLLGLPIVHCSHPHSINIDLRNETSQLDLTHNFQQEENTMNRQNINPIANVLDDGGNPEEHIDEARTSIVRLTRIDAYSNRFYHNLWKENGKPPDEELEKMSLQDFWLKYKVFGRGPNANKLVMKVTRQWLSFAHHQQVILEAGIITYTVNMP